MRFKRSPCCPRARTGHAAALPSAADELAPFHSMTSSWRASSVGCKLNPSVLAVFRLSTTRSRLPALLVTPLAGRPENLPT